MFHFTFVHSLMILHVTLTSGDAPTPGEEGIGPWEIATICLSAVLGKELAKMGSDEFRFADNCDYRVFLLLQQTRGRQYRP